MKTRKNIAAAVSLLLAAMMLSACNSGESSDASDTTPAETVSETVSDTVSDNEASSESVDTAAEADEEIGEETEIDLDELFPDDTASEDASSEASESVSAEEGESTNPLYPIVEKALAESEWPMMAEVTDPVILKEFFTLDPENENYSEMIVMQCPLSAVMSEIIIINANDVEAAVGDLDARRSKAIETDAWYPRDQELAAASIVGENGSYAYFVIGENAEAAEDSINAYIDENLK